jgi:hypothetical protein
MRAIFADALEVGDGLHHHHHHAQVGGGRLAARDDMGAILVDRHFQRIDVVVVGIHLVGQIHVALDERLDGVRDLLLDQATHFQHVGAHGFQLGVKLLVGVFSWHCLDLSNFS